MKIIPYSENFLKDFVNGYIEVWKAPPWNEAYKCVKCGQNYGSSYTKNFCEKDGSELEDFWKPDKVIEDLKFAMSQKDAVVLLAINGDDRVVGFTVWYGIDTTTIKRLELSNELVDFLFQKYKRVAYGDELGVQEEYRKNGIGSILTATAQEILKQKGYKAVFARTDKNSLALPLLLKQGFEVIEKNGRQIVDPKWGNRLYFVKEL